MIISTDFVKLKMFPFFLLLLFVSAISTLNAEGQSDVPSIDKEYVGAIMQLPNNGTNTFHYFFEKPSKVTLQVIAQTPARREIQMLYNGLSGNLEPHMVTIPPDFRTMEVVGSYTQKGNKIYMNFPESTVEATIVDDGMEGTVTFKKTNLKERFVIAKASRTNATSSSSSENTSSNLVTKTENTYLQSNNKYSTTTDNPLIGTWKYQDGCTTSGFGGFQTTSCNRVSKYIYSQNGNVQSIHIINFSTQTSYGNWKYISTGNTTGILEEYKEDKLIEKGNVKFLNKNQIRYTITYSHLSDLTGKIYIWNKQ